MNPIEDADPSSADPDPKPGVRLGPLTWVPEIRARPGDPWAHRKGEPRPLALLWSIYLMGSAALTLLGVRSLTMPTTEQFVFGCRGMLLMSLVGVSVLWPMVRLSQAVPPRTLRSLLGDLLVLLTPLQAVVWPMPMLTYWPWSVTAGLALTVASWAFLSAGVLSVVFRGGAFTTRSGAMALLVLVATAAPAARLILPGSVTERVWPTLRILSPLTAGWGLTDAPSGLSPVMQRHEWIAASAPGLFGIGLWVFSGRVASRRESGYSQRRSDSED